MLSADKSKDKTVTAANTVSLPAWNSAPSLQQDQPDGMCVLSIKHITDIPNILAPLTQIDI